MAFFSKKKKRSSMARELDKPRKKGENLQELQEMDYGFGEELYGNPNLQAEAQQFQQPRQSLNPRSISESNNQIMLNKIDIIDAKMNEIAKRLELIEKLIQSEHQQKESPYRGYQKRAW